MTTRAPPAPPAVQGRPVWPGAPLTSELLPAPITRLEESEVFVFGSNRDGFHGAGSAGLACRGEAANTWRTDEWFAAARGAPKGTAARVGRWAVYGAARGYQEGREGRSYAVQTIERPGARRSTSLRDIYDQLVDLVAHARAHPLRTYIITPLGEGYSGYSPEEMALVWKTLHARCGGLPGNFRFVRVGAPGDCALT